MATEAPPSVLSMEGPYASTCGYCSASGTRSVSTTNHSYGAWPLQLTCSAYQKMLDRGWRRSGTFLYKPNLRISCCPQYTIRLTVSDFSTSRSQRKTVNRFNRFISSGQTDDVIQPDGGQKSSKPKPPPFDLISTLHASETSFLSAGTTSAHKFEVTIEPSSFTEEKFALYCDYQLNVHNEPNKRHSSFTGFLCDTCLITSPIPYPSPPPAHLPLRYGTHHQLYRIDGELVAMGVLDILPNCVSSVYFMYLSKWNWCSLGKISALREAALVREIHAAGVETMEWLYMGFYIHSCPKMRYKGDYAPSDLLDPESYTWHPLPKCMPLLSKHRYAVFSAQERSSNEEPLSKSPAEKQPAAPPAAVLENVMIVQSRSGGNITVASASRSRQWQSRESRREILGAIEALGPELAQEIVLSVS